MLYAVAIAGVPGRIINDVLQTLQGSFTDNHVFRGAGSPLNIRGTTIYTKPVVDDALRLAADAVFRKNKRPHGFCRNTERPCALKQSGRDNCGLRDDQTCSIKKPDFLILFYQEGEMEKSLLDVFHYAALTIRIPKQFYNKRDKTVDFIRKSIKSSSHVLGIIKNNITSTKSPLLLPPQNYDNTYHVKLLLEAMKDGAKPLSEQFKREYYKRQSNSYAKNSHIIFKPVDSAGRHGMPDLNDRPEIALTRVFRLGCNYIKDFHYDVMRADNTHFSGKITFHCREQGPTRPRDKHINVSVDDCVI